MESKKIKLDFIVIGAGIAGLTAAYELKKRNKQVIVLEKNNFVGGRMSAKIIDGISFSLGAQFITPFYKNMNSYIKEFNLEIEKLSIGKLAIKRNGRLYNFDSDNLFSLFLFKGLSFENKLRLLFSLLTKLIEARKIDLYDISSYLQYDNTNIYDDLIKFIGQDGIDYFIDPMLNSVFGYSSKEFSKALFLAVLTKLFNSKLYSFKGGINQLVLKLASQLDVRKNFEVISVKRLGNKVIVTAGAELNDNLVFETDKVIIAVPGNKVLGILNSPNKIEQDFFSKVEYSKLGYVFFKSKETLLKDIETVWLPKRESKYFASFGINNKLKDIFYYSIELRNNIIDELTNGKNIDLKDLIRQQTGINNLEIMHIQLWQSAVPKFKPGYLIAMNKFLQTMNKNNKIYYCGDYLENPSTEGALTSGLKIVRLINDNKY